jgi:glucan phosphoethanolaminetransferase (alkaline phosphatase superfamily)
MASLHPKNAVKYVANPSQTNAVPAILWLVVALLAVTTLRNKALPSVSTMGAIAVGTAVVVFLGTFVPRLVEWFLLALLVAVSLGAAPQIQAFLQSVGANFGSLTPSATGGTAR